MEFIISLVILAFVLFTLEIFIPSTLLAIFGSISLAAAIVLAFINFGPLAGSLLLVGSVVICSIGFAIWASTFHRTPIGRSMTLESPVSTTPDQPLHAELLGKIGITSTPLLPSGSATFGSRRIDVIAEAGSIDAHEQVYVVSVDGMRVLVRKVDAPQFGTR